MRPIRHQLQNESSDRTAIGMDQRLEMARLTREVLLEFIQPVQLLTIDSDQASGAVSGRFRSGPLLFEYRIKDEKVSYTPLGGTQKAAARAGQKDQGKALPKQAQARGDASGPLQQLPAAAVPVIEAVAREQWIRRGIAYLAALWRQDAARVDSYLAAEVRMDGPGQKICSVGYQCGATCIARSKVCIAEGGNPQRLARLQQFAKGGGANEYKEAAKKLPPIKADPIKQGRDPRAAAVAEPLLKRMSALELETTPKMLELAAAVGGQMEGLAYRKKGLDSLTRKIGDEVKEGNKAYGEVAGAMSDVVRYTMMLSSESYVAGVEQSLSALEEAGNSVRVKNFWLPNQPYRGINVAVTSKGGDTYELQFHTPESLKSKHDTHPLYSKYREETNDAARRELWDTMVPMQNKTRSPLSPFVGPARATMKQRLLGIGQLKKFGFQTAREAGLA